MSKFIYHIPASVWEDESINTTSSPPVIPPKTDLTIQVPERTIYLRNTGIHVMTEHPQQRQLSFTDPVKEDINFWAKTDKNKLKRIKKLINAVQTDPFKGEGKPKPLKYEVYENHPLWARRIDTEHRLTYIVTDKEIIFVQARFHYSGQK